MSAYNPPKNQPPIFDTTQFYNQEQEKLNFPIAQGTETFKDIIINGTIIIPSTPIAYLNNTQTFTGATNTFNNIAITTGSTLTLNGTAYINQSSGTGQNILNTIKFNNSTSNKQITLYENSSTNLATNHTISVESLLTRYNVNSGASHVFSTGTGVSTYTTYATINSSGLTLGAGASISMSGSGIIGQLGSGTNSLKSTSITNLSVSGTLTLPNQSISDLALSTNVPLKSANNTYSGTNTYNNTLTLNSPAELVLTNSRIYQVGGPTNIMATIVFDTAQSLYINGGFINQTSILSSGTNTLNKTSITDLSVSGSISLPALSISDSALSSNVPLKNNNNIFTGINTFATIKFANSTSVQQITLYEVSPTNYAENFSFTINPYTLRYNTNSTGNHIFSWGSGTTYTDVATINSTGLTMDGKVSVRSSNFIELLDSTNTIASYITQASGTLDIHNFGTGSVKITSPSLDLTNTYTYIQGAELDYGSTLAFLDSTQTYATDLKQSSTDYIIENQYNSSSIILRNKNASGTAVNHTFSYNAISLNAPITMGTNNNLTMQGSGKITQASGSSTNTLNPTQFLGDITFAVGVSRIDQSGGGNGALLRQLNMLANYDIIFNVGTGKIDQTASTGVNLMGAITLNSNSNITLAGSGIISQPGTSSQNIFSTLRFNNSSSNKQITLFQSSATNLATNYTISIESPSILRYNAGSIGSHYFSVGTGVSTYTNYAIINSSGLTLLGNMIQTTTSFIDQSANSVGVNLLKAITMNAGTNLTQTTTSIIDQSSSTGGINLLKAITMNAGTNLLQSGSGILSQTGTGINLMKNITQNVDCNLLQSGIGVITQSGSGTNALKGTTFSASNTHYNGSAIIQYDTTNAVSTTLSQVNTSSYLIENNYNSSEIRLRNKNAVGGSVDYVFAYGGATFNTTLYFENNNVVAYRSGGSNQTNVGQSGSIFVCWNLANSGSMIFRVQNSTGTSIDAITTDYNNTTIANNLVCNGTLTFPSASIADSALSTNVPLKNTSNIFTNTNQFNSDLIVYTSGSNYLKLTDGTSSTRQYQSSGDCVIENTKTYAGGFGDIIFSTKDNVGTGAERFRISHDRIKTSVNIELPSSYTTMPNTNQLGDIETLTIISGALTTMNSNQIYPYGGLTLTAGVWNLEFQTCFKCTTAGTISYIDWGISTSTTGFENKYMVKTLGGTAVLNNYYTNRMTRIVSISTTTSYNALIRVVYSSGVYQFGTTSPSTDGYVLTTAVRIG